MACSSSADNQVSDSPDGGPTKEPSPVADAATATRPDGAAARDASEDSRAAADAAAPPEPAPGFTLANVPLPPGFTRVISDRFGTARGQTVTSHAETHAKYYLRCESA